MTSRRSFLTMLGLAPIAATVPAVASEGWGTIRVRAWGATNVHDYTKRPTVGHLSTKVTVEWSKISSFAVESFAVR